MARKTKKSDDEGMPSAPFWMTTYGDMVTLLLTFFVLMFAMSTIETQKFNAAANSLRGALGVLKGSISVVGERSPAIGTTGISREQMDMVESLERIAEIFQEEELEDVASVEVTGPGEVVIRMGDQVLFAPGQARLKDQANRVLAGIARAIEGETETVYVEGHTDNIPITTAEFPSNWELSSARAISVVRLLEEEGIPSNQLAAVGRSQYIPLEPNDSPANRAKNRRVELYITWREFADE